MACLMTRLRVRAALMFECLSGYLLVCLFVTLLVDDVVLKGDDVVLKHEDVVLVMQA